MASSIPSPVPDINLLLVSESAVDAFNTAKQKHNLPSSINVSIHEASLSQLDPSVRFDLIVSPANSSGILDGGFDDAISRAFSPRDDYFAVTRLAQDKLHTDWKGFAPPGTCTLVRLADDWASDGRSGNVWGAKFLALLPTMRVPNNVNWDREVVYECIWSLLNAVYNHNSSAISADEMINTLLMAPLATGAGYVPEARWASQLVLAVKHFVDAVERPGKGGGKGHIRVSWADAYLNTDQVARTWRKEGQGREGY